MRGAAQLAQNRHGRRRPHVRDDLIRTDSRTCPLPIPLAAHARTRYSQREIAGKITLSNLNLSAQLQILTVSAPSSSFVRLSLLWLMSSHLDTSAYGRAVACALNGAHVAAGRWACDIGLCSGARQSMLHTRTQTRERTCLFHT